MLSLKGLCLLLLFCFVSTHYEKKEYMEIIEVIEYGMNANKSKENMEHMEYVKYEMMANKSKEKYEMNA